MTDYNPSQDDLIRIGNAVSEQLADRLEGELSESDLLAVQTAITLGALRAFWAGAKAVAHDVDVKAKREGREHYMEINHASTEVDLWAERYGDG
jgi:hypothetical protein